MGLDMYLRAKTETMAPKQSRGACNGLFPLAPADNGTTEIGYWRKAYAVQRYLRETLGIGGEFNLEDKEISYEQILEIIKDAKSIIEEGDYEDEWKRKIGRTRSNILRRLSKSKKKTRMPKSFIWSGTDEHDRYLDESNRRSGSSIQNERRHVSQNRPRQGERGCYQWHSEGTTYHEQRMAYESI